MDRPEIEPVEDLTKLLTAESATVQPFPEKRLLAAVLARAIYDLLLDEEEIVKIGSPSQIAQKKFKAESKKENKEAAISWFIDDAAHDKFSFNWICDGLGFNSCCLRKRITRFLVNRPEAQSALAILKQMLGKNYAEL